jgi:thiol-disulfide isomerase/thioredoxin
LDFWATWCPPCQAPMAHNQKMLEDRGKDWGDKVRLIGLSIDNTVDVVKNHVESKKWTSVENYHVRTAGCTADKDYGVQGVPQVVLVDKRGKIVFVGHPSSRNLEKDIDALLKGNEIGEGRAKASASSTGQAADPDLTPSEAAAALSKFKTESKEFNEQFKDTCSKLTKGFLLVVDKAQFDCKDKEFKHKLECHVVL